MTPKIQAPLGPRARFNQLVVIAAESDSTNLQ